MSPQHNGPSADAIRADIERTRERLGDTVEALGAHLNPSLLKARVKESVHEATIGRAKTMAKNVKDKAEESGRGLVESIRENPIPVAMIAGGIGWLLFGRRRADDVRLEGSAYGTELGTEAASTVIGDVSAGDGASELDSSSTIDYSREMPQLEAGHVSVADRVKSAGERVATSARSAGEHVVSGARTAGERVTSGARTASERVVSTSSQLAHTVADRARAGGRRVEETYDSNPMVLGAVAAAVGLAIGMTLPVSDREAELMGGKRDRLVDKARETLSDTKDKVRSAAERAMPEVRDTLKDVAREEGLTGA
jgi:ElaB/YqjD/DUF883 family membrane-anchored ribosome-binding protein